MEQIESLRVSKLDDRRRVCFNGYIGGSHGLEAYSPYPFPNQWDSALTACAGAVISGAGGAYKGNESQEAVVKKCLVSRGYKVLN